jgi:galactosylceramidase
MTIPIGGKAGRAGIRIAFAAAFALAAYTTSAGISPADFGQTISLGDSPLGKTFDGIGALSAGASSRLLIDYPEPQRSRILDLLFKPRFGASLHHLKVEIPGDVNSTDGTEPSFAHTREEFLHPDPAFYRRGYEYGLMKEAARRNPDILLDCLQWGAPGWIGNGQFFSQDNADYIVRFIEKAKEVHGLDIDYAGVWNERTFTIERPFNNGWIKLLKAEFLAHKLSTKIVAADEVAAFVVAEEMLKDPALLAAVDVLGNHYQSGNPKSFDPALLAATGKPVWSSEDGPWRGDWEGAAGLAKRFNRNYIDYGMTKTIFWSLVTSYADILPIPGSGIMRAATPWSGHYEIQPALWAVAHFTQFTAPGWVYLKNGCGYTSDRSASFTTLQSPDGGELSMIIETTDAKTDQKLSIDVGGGTFADREFHLWKSDPAAQFVRTKSLKPRRGKIDLEISRNSIYTLTTTEGQRKGDETLPIPLPAAFPVPYADDFEGYEFEALPLYTQDQAGVFEVRPLPRNGGKALRQVVPSMGIEWHFHLNSDPVTIIGDPQMGDYEVSIDTLLDGPRDSASVYGRIAKVVQHQIQPPMSYWLRVEADGSWTMGKNEDLLLLNRIDLDKSWPGLKYAFSDHTRNARIFGYDEFIRLDESVLDALPGVRDFLAKDSNPKTLKLGVHFDGSFYLFRSHILGRGKIGFKPGEWNNLKLRCQGKTISGFVNGQKAGEFADETYPRGLAGFGCGWHTAWFDNLSIRGIQK